MITKCLVALAVVAQISAFKYQECYCKPEHSNNNYKYSFQSAPTTDNYQRIVTVSSLKPSHNSNQNVGYARPINSSPITRNLVVKGRYPVTLQNSGPAPDRKIPVVTSHLRAPVQEKPTVRLQTKIPEPKTIAHTCTCYKTIVKPKVQQHLITVPTIQRYIETLHRPVVENIHYEAYPVKCLDSANSEVLEEKDKTQVLQIQPLEVSSIPGIQQFQSKKNSEVQTFELPTVELPKIQSEKAQVIEIPRIQFADQKSQTIEIPRVQFIQSKKPQTVEIAQRIELPRVQFVEPQKSEVFEIPRGQFSENKKPQFVEILNAQFVDNKSVTAALPRLEFLQAQKVQTVEIPRIQVEESPKVQTVEIPQPRETITLGTAPFAYQFKA